MDNQGNMIVVWILAVVLIVFGLGYLLLKYQRVNAMSKAIKAGDFEKILVLCDEPRNRKMLGNYTCDLYQFNALRSLKRMDELKEALDEAIANYGGQELEKILELYYHYFLNHKDYTYALKLLSDIRDTGNNPFILCSEWSYQVIAEGRHDLFNAMEDAVNANTFKGYSLGIVLYLMGLQLEWEGGLEEAKGYYQTAMECLPPLAIYKTLCERHIDAVDDRMDTADA